MIPELTFSLESPEFANPDVLRKFAPFVGQQEARIQRNLEEMHYNIDALDAVQVVTGPGRIEAVSTETCT